MENSLFRFSLSFFAKWPEKSIFQPDETQVWDFGADMYMIVSAYEWV